MADATSNGGTAAGGSRQGFHRYRLGDFEITAVADGGNTMPLPDTFVVNAEKSAVSAALADAGLDPEMLRITFTPIVVKTPGELVVIDAGMGEANIDASKGANGHFQANLKAAGLDRSAVTRVIISHFHGDHINGLLTADGGPAFPNAEILVPQPEWDFWMDDGRMSQVPEGRLQDAFKNTRRVFGALGNKITHYAWDKEVLPGITATGTPGHTPGHTSFFVKSGAAQLFVQSDVTNLPALFVRHPGWHAMFDMDANQAEATRRRVYDRVAAEKMPVQGFHFPFPGLARIEKKGDSYRETMLSEIPAA